MSKQEETLQGTVYSAVPLDEAQRQTLIQTFTKKFGEPVSFTEKIDATLMGGYKVSICNKTYDNTLKQQLTYIRENLIAD